MIRLIFGLLLLVSVTSIAQVKSTILDNVTKEPIPYVNIWVEGEDVGTTADENGNFELNDTKQGTNLVFSAVGYGTISIELTEINETILLKPQTIQLEEVVINSKKRTGKNKRIVNGFKKVDQEQFVGIPDIGPFMLGRYVPYKPEYAHTPYLSTIKFKGRKHKKEFTFNLRLYTVNEDGSPGDMLHDKNIIIKQAPKKQDIIADLSMLNITIPPEGIFIVAEFLIKPENICSSVYDNVTDAEGNMRPEKEWKFLNYHYGPEFIHEQMESPDEGWLYKNGKWKKVEWKFKNKYGVLAAEVTLTD
jgi:hypothetical protein